MKKLFTLFALGAAIISANSALIKEGQSAPQFNAKTVTNKTFHLAALRGKVVLLDFWAVGCPPCKIEMPVLQQWSRLYGKKGLVVVGVTEMNPTLTQVKKALHEQGITYPIVLDPSEKIGKLYHLEAHPTTLLLDRKGRIIKTETGYLRGDEKAFEQALKPLLESPERTSQ